MPEPFLVPTTSTFEREFRKVSKGNPILVNALEGLIATLQEDPYNSSGQHNIKKLTTVKPGDGQWRIRWRDYRLRYDILGGDVVMHAFRHGKEAYQS